jgi:flavodoxin I
MTDISVFVDSRGGNTMKLAEAIAEELGVPIGDLTAPLPDDVQTLFLGSGTYGGKAGEAMAKFIASGTFTGRKVALFATSGGAAGAEKMIASMADALTKTGATIRGSYHCRGKFLFTNRGRPNQEDRDAARKFARDMLKGP